MEDLFFILRNVFDGFLLNLGYNILNIFLCLVFCYNQYYLFFGLGIIIFMFRNSIYINLSSFSETLILFFNIFLGLFYGSINYNILFFEKVKEIILTVKDFILYIFGLVYIKSANAKTSSKKFEKHQLELLNTVLIERNFLMPTQKEIDLLSRQTGLNCTQIKTWFYNKRRYIRNL